MERSRLVRVARGWRRRVLEILADFGGLDAPAMESHQAEFEALPERQQRRQLLMLQLHPSARRGQPEILDQVEATGNGFLSKPGCIRELHMQ